MSNGKANKRRGTGFEYELVGKLKKLGFTARRAYCSNGEALGEVAEVDIYITEPPTRISAKRRKTLPQYLQVPEGVDVVVFRQDRGETLVLMNWGKFIDYLRSRT